ncbi:DUF4389 domain-containing protein [Prauserella cavernicola]|uniref:DUF4389 domain-containing protein n=1 Tax=Prauserella cavernicola TaxID=2800127 RepID=A0A934QPK9_9PSEU|nr:DUF4389 domain-containing protein [Prauserella cavernicola]MBK1783173.1 DUF4389 domain-containing protein [Prauserella cavernicola]
MTGVEHHEPYPVRVEAALDPALSRWLWLVKWLLAIPHYILLALLWIAFVVLTVVAFFAILITGSYPRPIFDFNVGVLRWSWRVHYYTYAALGTDRYPPFTLADEPGYPARLDIDYPERLSRGLVLIKWWLLAIPQYFVVGVFVGGGLWFASSYSQNSGYQWAAGGLVGILVFIAGVVLLFTGRYPRPVFDFVLGMDRWVVRVAAYAGLMTDRYPPFRLDLGGQDPGGPVYAHAPEPVTPPLGHPGWTPGRIVSVVLGGILVLTSMGLLTGGGALLWADRNDRDADGFLGFSHTLDTGGYALVSERIGLSDTDTDWVAVAGLAGDVRVRVTGTDPADDVFVGIARSGDAQRYLSGVRYSTVTDPEQPTLTQHGGGAPPARPGAEDIWVAEAGGRGTQTVYWPSRSGTWTVVAMNANGSPGVDVRVDAGAKAPALTWIAVGLLALGVVLLAGGVALVAIPVQRASRTPGPPRPESADRS